MRVLVLHNQYLSDQPSGENVVVADEIDMLRGAGVDVVTHVRSSDEIADLPARQWAYLPLRPTYSPEDVRAVRRLISDRHVDVVHVHNLTPLLSPAVIRTAQGLGVPVVQTVHNHRHVCMKGTYFRDGRECRDCLGHRFPHPGVQHGCYRGSRAQSLSMGVSMGAHHGTWRGLDRYLALTPQIAAHLESAGFPADRVEIRPNTVDDPGMAPQAGSGFVFVGRVNSDKGIDLLLDAWTRRADGELGPLTVVGDGERLAHVRELAAQRRDVRATGLLDPAAARQVMSEAAVVVIPSLVPDVFPRVVVEALALGKPVIGTEVGGLPGVLTPESGWLVSPQADALAAVLRVAAQQSSTKRHGARARYVDCYSPDKVLKQLLDVYEQCIGEGTRRRAGVERDGRLEQAVRGASRPPELRRRAEPEGQSEGQASARMDGAGGAAVAAPDEESADVTGRARGPARTGAAAKGRAARRSVVLVGQVPPPIHGQAMIIRATVDAEYSRITVRHVPMAFSRTLDEIGIASSRKAVHIFATIARILWSRFRFSADVLYYPPAGPNIVPVVRDIAILICTRWAFRHTVFHFHAGGLGEIKGRLPRLLRPLFELAYDNPDLTIRPSEFSPDDGRIVRTKRDEVLPLAVPVADTTPCPPLAERPSPPKVLFAGTLRESKGVFVLLEALGELRARGVDFRCDILGAYDSTDISAEVARRVDKLDLAGHVEFLGVRSGEAFYDTFREATVFCFPTFYESENFPLVLLEAMSAGLPIVATRWRGVASIVRDGETGALVPIRDPLAVADTLQVILTRPDTAEAMSCAARETFLKEYTLASFVSRLETLLASL